MVLMSNRNQLFPISFLPPIEHSPSMKRARLLSGAQWLAVCFVFLYCSDLLYPCRASALNAGPQVQSTTLVESATSVTTVYIDANSNVLYFGGGYPASGYIGRVALGSDCGTEPLTAVVVAGGKGQSGLQDGVGSGALFNGIHDIEGTADGKTLYLSDYYNNVIRMISISIAGGGVGAMFNVTTIAGSVAGFLDGIGRAAQLRPVGLALNAEESALYVGDYGNAAIRRITLSSMMVETLVQDSPSTPIATGLTFLRLTPDSECVIFADSSNHRVAKVSSVMGSATTITNIAGALGQIGVLDGVDGSRARFSYPRGLTFSPDASMLFVGSVGGNVIQAVRLDGTNPTITVVGNGTYGYTEAISKSRAYMQDPVATFNNIQGIALWELPAHPQRTNAAPWALIAADFSNGVIRCVSGPGVSSPFPPLAFEALASTAGTVRGVVSAGSSNDAYIHPVTGALFTSAGPTSNDQWTVVRYDLDNCSGAFIDSPVIIAGSTAGYADGVAKAALFSSIYGFAGDGGHMIYVTEYFSNYYVRSINITSFEVRTVAGNGVSALVDGVGAAASLRQPVGLACHPLRLVLYVAGLASPLRKIDLATRNVTTLNVDVNWPNFLRLTPSYDALFISSYKSHTIVVMDTAMETLIRVVAGASDVVGTADGFGSNSRFTNPEGIAFVGLEYGWPCLYVHEESPAYIREIRLRDQYVRTIPLVGLPAAFDIEGIISYTNRTSGEFGLLLINRGGTENKVFFMPIGIVPSPTPSASNDWTPSTTTSETRATTTVAHSLVAPSSSNSITSFNSYSDSFSATTRTSTASFVTLSTQALSDTTSMCRCSTDVVRVALSAPVGLCVACRVEIVGDTIAVLDGRASLDTFASTAPAQLQSAPIARASLLLLPSAPFLVTLVVNGSSCWYASSVATDGLNTLFLSGNVASSAGSQDDEFSSVIELLVTPKDGGWLSGLASGDLLYQSTSLRFNATLRCSTFGDLGANDRFVLVTVPCPALPRTLASEVSTGVVGLQWISAVGGPGASGAMGRLTAVRSLAMCSAAGGLIGLVTIELPACTETSAEDSVGGLLGNVVILVVVTFLLLTVCWLLSPPQSHTSLIVRLVAGARRTAFPSTLLPIATMLIPTTAGLAVVVLRDLADVTSPTAACQVSVTVTLVVLALCFCAVTVAVPVVTHLVATSHLVLLELRKSGRAKRSIHRSKLVLLVLPWLSKGYRWESTGGAEGDDEQRCHFAVLLSEFRLLWYCVLDLLTLFFIGVLAGVAQSSGNSAVCAGCGVATCCACIAQFGVCVWKQPFMSTFGNVCAALTLLLNAMSAGLQAALLVMQAASSSLLDVAVLDRLMVGSAVCDLCVMGISSLRLVLDLHELLNAVVRRVKNRCFSNVRDVQLIIPLQTLHGDAADGVLRSPSSSVSLALPTACDATPDNLYGGDCTDKKNHLDSELVGLFWDSDGNAVLQDDVMIEHDTTDLINFEVRN
ncbi:membrane-associated protein, putative [Bodo saltans]|uniref:Membrane-associated protein, putative n=1 Tax=Bodo saltans TaxID=75058 RepID=A0A0S4IJ32_BODSA|nr:membrane-associated protein, putative [Bodo saltans]|eukprot:CUE74485.1 membrane-associated protein, putative [Bodo saltans]